MKNSRHIKNYQVYDFFMENHEHLGSVEFLTSFLTIHCKFNRVKTLRGSWLRILQVPIEFAQFLVFMKDQIINSYLEIGISTGGSLFTIDSYLRAVNPNYQCSLGVDKKYKLRDYDFYKQRFPTCSFHQVNSNKFIMPNNFDMTFIDATHQERWVLNDFNKTKDKSKYIGFHDISLRNGATVSVFWEKIKKDYQHWEFIDTSLEETCGIGVIKLK